MSIDQSINHPSMPPLPSSVAVVCALTLLRRHLSNEGGADVCVCAVDVCVYGRGFQ